MKSRGSSVPRRGRLLVSAAAGLAAVALTAGAAAARTYVSVGASVAYGIGASPIFSPRLPVDVAMIPKRAQNFSALVARELPGIDRYQNVSISGATLERMLAEEVGAVDPDAAVITVSAGTNDVVPVARGTLAMSEWRDEFDRLLNALREQAPQATIVLVTSRNSHYLDTRGQAAAVLTAMNAFIAGHFPRYAVADLACDERLYRSDAAPKPNAVHPTNIGYAEIARVIVQSVRERTPPQTACPPYTSHP